MMISIKGTLKTHWIKIKLVRIKMIDKLLPWFPSIDIAMYFFYCLYPTKFFNVSLFFYKTLTAVPYHLTFD